MGAVAHDNEVLLLGLLRQQSQHGYQINDFIERNLSRMASLKKATAYALLERLREAGHISAVTVQEGNRPPRQVYTITPSGQERFATLLRHNLSTHAAAPAGGDIGLMFLDQLPRQEAVACLSERLESLQQQLREYEAVPTHGPAFGVDLAVQRMIVSLRAEAEWLASTVAALASSPD